MNVREFKCSYLCCDQLQCLQPASSRSVPPSERGQRFLAFADAAQAVSQAGWWRRLVLGFGFAIVMSLWCGCSRTPNPDASQMPPDAVATVNGVPILEADYRQLLARRGGGHQGSASDVEALKRELLADLIRQESLYQKAVASGFDQTPEVQKQIKRLIAAGFLEEQSAGLTPSATDEAELRAYHAAHAAEFSSPERRRVALIDVQISRTASLEEMAKAENQAQEIRQAAVAPEATEQTFGQLAQQHSNHQGSRYRGGDIGWLQADSTGSRWGESLLQAAFDLSEPGSVSPVLRSSDGFQILKLLEVEPARLRPFSEVRPGIEYVLTREQAAQQQQAMELRILAGLDVRTNHALLQTISLPPTKTAPPSVPGGLSRNDP